MRVDEVELEALAKNDEEVALKFDRLRDKHARGVQEIMAQA